MIYTKECVLRDFKFWSGAKDRADELSEEELDTIEACLDDLWAEKPPSESDINDLFWFDEDFLANCLGFDDWESLEAHHREIDE